MTVKEVDRNKELLVKASVLSLMQQGKASIKRGWVMSDILKEIKDKHGESGMKVARDYIVKDHCGITEED